MTLEEAAKGRHSVRSYRVLPIPDEIRAELDACALECNEEGGLSLSIQYDDPSGFDSALAHYGSFRNVSNYIVLAGKKDKDFDLRCGYYGEKLVIRAQQLGLNTCWTAMTFNRRKVRTLIKPGESLCMAISLGYGETQGKPHRGKKLSDITDSTDAPDWFIRGAEAALLAPTAMNQQKFFLRYRDGEAVLSVKGFGPYTAVDLGIVQYHFELGSGHSARTE